MFLTGLDRVLRNAGVPFTARSGWRTNTAHSGGLTAMRCVLWHTTESAASAFRSGRDAPTLAYVERGLGYPLYNILIGRSGHAYLIAAGTSAHAGKGSGYGMPTNNGNRYSIGLSFDANNTTHPVTAAQLESGARIGAAIDREWRGGIRHVMHGEWAPGRRSDPTRVPGGWSALRAAISRGYWSTKSNTTPAKTTPTPRKTWLEMVSKNELKALLREEGWAYKGSNESRDAYSYLRSTLRTLESLDESLEAALNRLPRRVWGYKGSNEPSDAYAYLRATRREVAAVKGENEGLLKALEQAGSVNVDEVRKAAREGVEKALKSIEADVTLNVETSEITE